MAGQLILIQLKGTETWEDSLIRYFTEGFLLSDALMVRSIKADGRYFAYGRCRDMTDPDVEDVLFHIDKDGTEAPYLQEGLRNLFVKRMHELYGYLGYPGLLGAIGMRAWWLLMCRDIQTALHECPACQVSQ